MRAVAVVPGDRAVRVVDLDVPQIARDDEVLLRVLEVGICGTDREICSFDYGSPPPGEGHLILGHECLAVVEAIGAGVDKLAVGDLVVPTVRRQCEDPGCAACRAGHQDFCTSGAFTERGISGRHGFMTEFVVEEQHNLAFVPPGLRDIAVLTEPLTIAEKALLQVFALMAARPPWLSAATPAGERGRGMQALVLGVGPVGLLGAMALVTAGFTTTVYSRELPPSPRVDLVESIGATYRSSQAVSFEALAEELGNIDLIYEAAGQSHFALDGLRALGTNGIFVLTGVPGPQAMVNVDPAQLMRDMVLRNQVLLGTVNAGSLEFALAIESLAEFSSRWPGLSRALLADRGTPEEAPEFILGRQQGIKSVIAFEHPS